MEQFIAKLVQKFEQGQINRRDLIRGLTLAAASCSGTMPANAQGVGFKATGLNHISYQLTAYARTRDFYADLLGMKVSDDDGKRCVLSVGDVKLLARTRTTNTPGVDHFAHTIANWDKTVVEAELKRRGLRPELDSGGNEESFHVSDPDGFDLQISSGRIPQRNTR